ncbi:hypothetical protein E2562_031593 [Oryza meyeriana var. granulata]|uniref:Uncharacterized protein n=1 Tax=Oryza meyeriana var. granulata TaxID=110450 RepID=A0A6G1CJU0_9ORYZ|nr:hypothetical protein E2562_031593 [Oryza meyeriana var. granulata]
MPQRQRGGAGRTMFGRGVGASHPGVDPSDRPERLHAPTGGECQLEAGADWKWALDCRWAPTGVRRRLAMGVDWKRAPTGSVLPTGVGRRLAASADWK